MARSYRPVDRDQRFLIAPDMADWLPPDHLVWFVLDVVSELDTTALHRNHPVAGPGRAAYDPDMLLGLLMYAYATGERSSRRIERLCGEHVAFRIVCAQDVPDHTTIARFRQNHEGVFADLFAQVLTLCAQAGMGRVGVVAIDGTKIAANASKATNRTEPHVRALAKAIIEEAAAADAAEDTGDGDHDSGQLPPSLRDRTGRRDRIKKALAEFDDQHHAAEQADADHAERIEEFLAKTTAGESVKGTPPRDTDPVRFQQAQLAGALIRADQATDRSRRYEAQRQARRAQAALNALTHAGQREPVSPRAPQRHRPKVPSQVNLTDPDSRMVGCPDGGVIQGYNAQLAVSDDHLILATSITQEATDYNSYQPLAAAAVKAAEVFETPDGTPGVIGTIVADAGYLSRTNLTAPGPDRLIAIGKNRQANLAAREHPASGPPPPVGGKHWLENMSHRLRTPEGHAVYRRRSATVEPVIGHLKDITKLRRFSRRGITAAAAELDLAAMMINITRLHRAQSH